LAVYRTIRPCEEINDVEDAEEAIEMEEESEEARVPKVLKSPLQPTARELESRTHRDVSRCQQIKTYEK
jgi:hypothetical protein